MVAGTAAVVLLAGAVPAANAGAGAAAGAGRSRHTARATTPTFKPRIGTAMGIIPKLGIPEIASGRNWPVVYHGGNVMRNVTVHTVFWAPPGYHFDGPPSNGPLEGTLGYEALVKQFLVDVAHDSTTPQNLFSTLTQYADPHGAGETKISYDPSVDSVDLTAPYPALTDQCASPSGIATCVTDLQIEQQLDTLIGPNTASQRGLSNIWFVFLPPDVDTCIQPNSCATTAYAGYHSLFDLGNGTTVYVPIPDPLVEFNPPPGSDPEQNPEGETTIDTVAHEAEEAITDPYGTAWMDPDGFEVADKCESGPQIGTPLGYASDGSPYNQVINGHEYLIQDMWSNSANGCVQSSTTSTSPLPLHTVSLRQFSSKVSGSIGVAKQVKITIGLLRSSSVVAVAHTTSRADGTWGPVQLRSRSGAPHAIGDDREGLAIEYGNGSTADLVATGDGGNPFTESGYTGWFDLDHGYAVGQNETLLGPCGQTGVLTLRIGTFNTEPPAQLCNTETDAALIPTPAISPGTPLTLTSEDNRAESPIEPNGALVKLSVSLGEPDSVPAVANNQLPFLTTGFPQCTAFLRIQSVRCTGLVPETRYRIGGRRAKATVGGAIFATRMHLHGGQALTLTNGAGRRLTTLHVAHLRVAIIGDQTQIASGSCQPGDFYGPQPTSPPSSSLVGLGAFGNGTICPSNGQAKGLSTKDIAQLDDFSGGVTQVQVPLIQSTSPVQDETLYGSFFASAQSGLPGPHGSVAATGAPIALTIYPAGSKHSVFHSANVDTARGIAVSGLTSGPYTARWVLHDANGDTRTVMTRFSDQG